MPRKKKEDKVIQAIFAAGGEKAYNRKLQEASENLSTAQSSLYKTKAAARGRSGSGRVVGKKVALTFTKGYKMQTGGHQNNTEGNFSGKDQVTAEGFGTFGTYKRSKNNVGSIGYRKKKEKTYDKVEVTSGTETNLDGTPKVTATYTKTTKRQRRNPTQASNRRTEKEISGKKYRRKKEKINKQLSKGKFDAVQRDYQPVATPKRTATRKDVREARKNKRIAKREYKSTLKGKKILENFLTNN